MDRSLRELGIGDLGVPKRMKKMAEAFYGRAGAYREATAAGDVARLADALSRNVYPAGAPEAARSLAAYVIGSAAALALTSSAELKAGEVRFADLAAHAPHRNEAVA
jgi:cytochrome b pre-mRNA-processing protein 3